ncbi:hypothetical protein NQ315_007101 [Exocentrus adspersus]|uniref:dUTPase-like domain-containing protein n=1 Tax=Exocentrus adspersus TaxID=1586481 RepID=A0AAV8WCH1_9CUCU|nr:hypothetical protein NQ315_007101 [Exocentrus adspersus]
MVPPNLSRQFGKPLLAGVLSRVNVVTKYLCKRSKKLEDNTKMPAVNGSLVLKYTKELTDTQRGEGGFGSTGTN